LNRIDIPVAAPGTARPGDDASHDVASKPRRHLQSLAQHLMLQRFAPACVLINGKSEVLFLSGPVDRYLQLPPGELASDLLAMARPGLRMKLRAAIQQAIRDDRPVSLGGLRVTRDGKRYAMRLAVEPLHQPREAEGLMFVAFDEDSADERSRLEHVERQARSMPDESESPKEYESLIRQLEDELRITREERNQQRRVQGVQRRGRLGQRRVAIDQRGTGNLARGTALAERGTTDGQHPVGA
jgi:two-component system CheB/CheR fusion protein